MSVSIGGATVVGALGGECEQIRAASLKVATLGVRSRGGLIWEEEAGDHGGEEAHRTRADIRALKGEREWRRRDDHQGTRGLARAERAAQRGLDPRAWRQ